MSSGRPVRVGVLCIFVEYATAVRASIEICNTSGVVCTGVDGHGDQMLAAQPMYNCFAGSVDSWHQDVKNQCCSLYRRGCEDGCYTRLDRVRELFKNNELLVHMTKAPEKLTDLTTRDKLTGISATLLGKDMPRTSEHFSYKGDPQQFFKFADGGYGIILDARAATRHGALGSPSDLHAAQIGSHTPGWNGNDRSSNAYRNASQAREFIETYCMHAGANKDTYAVLPDRRRYKGCVNPSSLRMSEQHDLAGLIDFLKNKRSSSATDLWNEIYLVKLDPDAIVGVMDPLPPDKTDGTAMKKRNQMQALLGGKDLGIYHYMKDFYGDFGHRSDEWCPVNVQHAQAYHKVKEAHAAPMVEKKLQDVFGNFGLHDALGKMGVNLHSPPLQPQWSGASAPQVGPHSVHWQNPRAAPARAWPQRQQLQMHAPQVPLHPQNPQQHLLFPQRHQKRHAPQDGLSQVNTRKRVA